MNGLEERQREMRQRDAAVESEASTEAARNGAQRSMKNAHQ
jgi:hypothetical protein